MNNWEDLFVELEGKKVSIVLLSDYIFRCQIKDSHCDYVEVYIENPKTRDFDKIRYVAYNAIAYVDEIK